MRLHQQNQMTSPDYFCYKSKNIPPRSILMASQNLQPRYLFKVLVIGNSKCGKSSSIERFVNGTFSGQYKSTIGADFLRKSFNISANCSIKLQLWDIAGQDRFASLIRPYYRNAKGAIIVCDVTRPATIEAAKQWKRELDEKLDDNVPSILLGNKSDLLTSGKSTFATGALIQQMASEMGFQGWFISSAKDDSNVSDAFDFLSDCMVHHSLQTPRQKETPENQVIMLEPFPNKINQSNCC